MAKKIVTIVRSCAVCPKRYGTHDDWCTNMDIVKTDGDWRAIDDTYIIPDWCPLEEDNNG